ncbi:MAG: hypothetical protein KGM18_05985 [Sphingomonadales bacterium]|nr:hypothetical protein [Sphingomonadales bacterium]
MGKRYLNKAVRALFVLLMLAAAMPARAEKLVFDHRLYAPLKAVLDSGDNDMIAYNASNPRYVVDLIAVKGKSASDWSEALEIIARSPAKGVRTARDWRAELDARPDGACKATTIPIAEDAASLTFERQMPGCPAARAVTTYSRILGGKRSLFMLTVLFKTAPDESTRQQWLALLQSAHIE